MAKRLYTVPIIIETTELWEVEASSPGEAGYLASQQRHDGFDPTHTQLSKFRIGTVKPTVTTEPEEG